MPAFTESRIKHLCGWAGDNPRRHIVAALFGRLSQVAPQIMMTAPIGDVMLYRAWTEVLGSEPPYKAQTIGDCYTKNNFVWGERMKPIDQVKVGDRVWTGEGKLTKVISTRSLQTMKPLVKIKAVGSLPITCTADHKMLVYRLGYCGKKRITSSLCDQAKAGRRGEGSQKKLIIDRYESRTPQWVAASELTHEDCLLTPLELEIPDPFTCLPDSLCSTDDGMWVLGFFLGNGHASGGSVEFCVSDPVSANRIIVTLKLAGFNSKDDVYYKDCEAWRIRVHSKDLVYAFRQDFYDEDGVKVFPSWALGDSSFLLGLEAADGHSKGKVHHIDSTSRSIIGYAVASLIEIGFDPVVNLVSRSEGTYDNAKNLYRIEWREDKQKQYSWRDNKFLCRPVMKTEFIEGPETVYDIGVADSHHSFLVDGHSTSNCVSHGHGHANDLLQCIEASVSGSLLDYRETLTEFVYGESRKVGDMLGVADGSCGSFAIKAMTEVGILPREAVPDGDYDGRRAKAWGATGPPPELEEEAQKYKIGAATLVKTWSELVAAIGNGYPVTICSDQGFSMNRDQDGICEAEGTWQHCMGIAGIIENTAVIYQSWGEGVPDGPLVHGMPSFSFRARQPIVERILSQGDSWALSKTPQFASRPLPASWSYRSFV